MGEFEMLSNGNESTVLQELLTSLKNHDIKKFQDLLNSKHIVDLDHYFGDPDLGTLLDICCLKQGNHVFVELLLKHGSNPNIVNKIRKKSPIHFTVQRGDIITLRKLLECPKTNVNILDSTGSCALHYAVKLPDTEIMEMLLLKENIDVNIANNKGKSPLLCALEEKNKNCALLLLNHGNINVHNDPKSSKLIEYLNEIIPDWNMYVGQINYSQSAMTFTQAFSLLRNGNFNEFIAIIRDKKNDFNFLEDNNGSHTFLQYCCEFGILNVVNELISLNINPNGTTNANMKTPLMIASYKGYVDIVRLLVDSKRCSFIPVQRETVLHCVVKGSSECTGLVEADIEVNHLECLSMLLAVDSSCLNINQGDFKGNTALHYAAKQGENEMVFSLLKAGASISCFNDLNEPAFADINYKTLKKYLDYCVTTNDKLPREESYEIVLNYSCLKPVNNIPTDHKNSQAGIEEMPSNKSYNSFECKALLYMTQNRELKYLLKHPIFTSFLYLKWHKIYKGFYVNLLFYFLFLISMTVYILNVYPNIVKEGNKPNGMKITYGVLWCLILVLLVMLIVREVAQFIIAPFKYLTSLENWLEIGIIYSSIKIMFFAENTTFNHKVQLSVITIMLSWSELVLLIGRHPALSTYIEMLKTVSWNFLKFLAWYFALIIAFSLSFFILFGMHDCSSPDTNDNECLLIKNDTDTDDDLFSNPGISLFKTIIMLTGEFDASSVPFVTHPGLSHALFIAFLFFIAIVLFNLLNGLAVSDTQAIQSDSELVGYISRVKLIAYVETLVSNPLPNKQSFFSMNFSSCWESGFINYCKNKMISKYINLFKDGCLSDDCEIRILPFYGNQVKMSNYGYSSNRKEVNQQCFKKCGFLEMDSSVLHSVKEILLEKHIEKELQEEKERAAENEKMFMKIIKDCNENIEAVKKVVNDNRLILDELVKIINGR